MVSKKEMIDMRLTMVDTYTLQVSLRKEAEYLDRIPESNDVLRRIVSNYIKDIATELLRRWREMKD
jgi:hypothetical protein